MSSRLLVCPRCETPNFDEFRQQLDKQGLPTPQEDKDGCFILTYESDEQLYGIIPLMLDTGFKGDFLEPLNTRALRNVRVPSVNA